MPRHRPPPTGEAGRLPDHVKEEQNDCLRSIMEETYKARGFAIDDYHADQYQPCVELLRAGEKEMVTMNNKSNTPGARCEAGERAFRKFWEAKICARRCGSAPRRKHHRCA